MSGGVYCPLSPEDPIARLNLCLAECRPSCIIIHSYTARRFDNVTNSGQVLSEAFSHHAVPVQHLSQLTKDLLSSSSNAAVLFTSGSTGQPKAGCQTHGNYAVHVSAAKQLDIFSKNDTVLQRTPVSFAMHLSDIISSLWVGASLILVRPGAHRNLNYILNSIESNQVSYIFLVPSMWGILVDEVTNIHKLHWLRVAVSAGTYKLSKDTNLLSVPVTWFPLAGWSGEGVAWPRVIECAVHQRPPARFILYRVNNFFSSVIISSSISYDVKGIGER